MKVCSTPVPFAEPDYRNYDVDAERKREDEHQEQIKQWLLSNGYDGPLTGEVYRTPRGDGYACYMFGDAGRQSILVHLPYGDAWHEPDVEFLPKKEIVRRMGQQRSIAKIFSKEAA